MNERIQELIEQASETSTSYFDGRGNITETYFNKEKFAELIIRECVNVALEQKKWVENQEVFNPRDESWNQARIQQSQRIGNKINEHFGVEE